MNLISAANIREALSISKDFLDGNDFTYIIPDGTRTLPIYESKLKNRITAERWVCREKDH